MLSHVRLQNIAIVEAADVSFEDGFTVITGETGSGKSVMIESIALAFGQKASPKDILRHGSQKGLVELHFARLTKLPSSLLNQIGHESPPDELLLSREFSSSTSRYRIDGVPITADVVQQLRPYLVDLHGQHELTSLFQSDHHRHLLDCLGSETFANLKQQYKHLYQEWRRLTATIQRLEAEKAEVLKQRDFYQFQFDELKKAELTDGDEDERLRQQLGQMKQGEALAELCQQTDETLLSGQDASVIEALESLDQAYRKQAAKGDNEFDTFHEQLAKAITQLRELADGVVRYGESLTLTADDLDKAVERLDLLERIRRKFGPTLETAITERDRLGQWLQQADDANDDIELLTLKAQKHESQLQLWSTQLHEQRQALASQLTEGIQTQLSELALPAATFSVNVESLNNLNEHGSDLVQFTFSANPGEPLRSLQDVASGGELSRVLLALKVLVAHHANVPTLVFDEIDTGISGPTARAVAGKLQKMAATGVQVLCITHQPLVAAAGQHHINVEKTLHASSVEVTIKPLTPEERKRLLVRLTTGLDATDNDLTSSLSDQLALKS